MVTVALFGVGRIGVIHGANLAASPEAELRYVVDVDADAALAEAAVRSHAEGRPVAP